MDDKKSILLVDDNADDRVLLELLCRQLLPDALIHAPADPVSLGEMLATTTFHAAVIEYRLGWCDAVGLVGKLRARNPQSAVIFFSREELKTLAPDMAELGLCAFFSKSAADLVRIPALLGKKLKTLSTAASVATTAHIQPPAPAGMGRGAVSEKIPEAIPETLKATFLADVLREISHDLMQPLQILVRQASVLEENYSKALDGKGQSLVSNLGDVARNMQFLLDAILSYYREDMGSREEGNSIDAPIGEVLETVLSTLRSELDAIGARVKVGTLPHLMVNRNKMVQLFMNLLGNAIKFRGDKPLTIRIDALDVKESWIFSVSDNGIGIKEKHQEAIFDMFKRLHGLDKYPGNGIGLSLCRRIVEQQGGKIWARSKPGEGTTISFTLPKPSTIPAMPNGAFRQPNDESGNPRTTG